MARRRFVFVSPFGKPGMAQQTKLPEASLAAGPNGQSTDRADAGTMRILVAEDEGSVGRAIERVLGRQGYEVKHCSTGPEALAAFDAVHYDAVVSDICMPGISGIDLLREVRSRSPETPVILITGRPTVDTAVEAVELGAFRYLTKPFRTEELRQVVATAVGHGRMARVRSEAVQVADSHSSADHKRQLADDFDRALDTLWMAFQPIIDRNWTIIGYEALLRCEESTLRNPLQFLSAAEHLDRGEELLVKARAAALAPIVSRPNVSLFMNVHSSQFGYELLLGPRDDFILQAQRIVLEISEEHHLADDASADKTICELKSRGFRLAVDDLGAGYSGLATFALIGPNFIKLDGALVRDAGKVWQKQRVITAVCEIAHDLGIEVIAEAVEKQSEFERLRELGCDYFQGFFVGRPEPLS